MTNAWKALVWVIAACWLGAPAIARQDSAPPKKPAGDAAPTSAPDADEEERILREFLQRGLDRAKRSQKTIEEAVAMLERGEPVSKVREFSREALRADIQDRAQQWRDRARDGEGPARPGGPGGGPLRRSERDGLGRPGAPGGEGPLPGESVNPGEPRPPRQPLSPEQALEIIKETNPQFYERISRLRKERPEEFERVMERFRPQLADLSRQRQDDPEGWPVRAKLFMLDRDANAAARRIAAMEPEQREQAKLRFRELLGRAFDARLKVIEADIARMQRRIAVLQAELKDKNGQRDELIDQRMEQMLKRAEDSLGDPLGPGPERSDREDVPPPPR